ncbi:SDR family oxidoreductase [Fulvivirgaceae bacterium BMA10]|uniref:SDR family oxidoreductase n=1 Tax=Splendidivirga corallicola TaxID=3051826 RepID=A0ABT8KXL5_9BACT|nr:SDR family oxidoreductase [Fulvivirgaceae bacterium BMA10]
MIQQRFIITGASSFLGRAFAKILTKNNKYQVFLTSRSKVNFNELRKNENVCYLPDIDLTIESDIEQLKETADTFFKGQFHVINCLGYFPGYKSIEKMDMATAKRVFDSNVVALYNVAHSLLPLMSKRRGGHFIGFSTHTSYQNYPKMAAFTAAKVAVESLIKGISNEYLEKGINANAIALATLMTEIEIEMKPNGDFKNWLNPEEVCEFVQSIILQPNNLLNGNIIDLYKHSRSFFHESYFDRIETRNS